MNGARGRKLRQVNDRHYSFDAIKGYFDIFLQVNFYFFERYVTMHMHDFPESWRIQNMYISNNIFSSIVANI